MELCKICKRCYNIVLWVYFANCLYKGGRDLADKSKKSSSAKRNTKKVSSSKRVQHKNEKDNLDYILDEILYIVLILFFAVLFVGNFLPEMVVFGPLASFLRGLFGIGSYFLSVLGIWYLSWEIKSKNKKLRKVKLIGIVILFFAVSIFTHLLGGKDSSEFAKIGRAHV